MGYLSKGDGPCVNRHQWGLSVPLVLIPFISPRLPFILAVLKLQISSPFRCSPHNGQEKSLWGQADLSFQKLIYSYSFFLLSKMGILKLVFTTFILQGLDHFTISKESMLSCVPGDLMMVGPGKQALGGPLDVLLGNM